MSKKLRILLADDSRFFRAIESKFLQKNPVEIVEADCCDSVLETARNRRPDLIYMAYTLPKDGGDACCRRIKADPGTRDIPVVMICDQGEPAQVDAARRAGCDAFLVKPLDRHGFLQVGRRFLEGIREHRQPSFFRLNFSVNDEEFIGKCLDISGGGMFIESPQDVASGTRITLNFNLLDPLSTETACQAEVTWQNRKPNPTKPHYPHGFGVKFINLSDAVQKLIVRLSEKKTTS